VPSVSRRSVLTPSAPFDLRAAVLGHGWFDLAPHRWDAGELRTAVLAEGLAVDLRITEARGGCVAVEARSARALGRAGAAEVRRAVRRMLGLDCDLAPFWELCRAHPPLHWVPERRAGRLMRSAGVFEDLLKLLFTTNCSWAATRLMCARTVDALGAVAPSGARAFPTAEACARVDEAFWREQVRAGYRAPHCVALSRAFAEGRLAEATFDDPELPTDELRRRLLALPGFGPYAAGQALRLLGHADDLALDSWCRARMARLLGRAKPPDDRWFTRRYARFGRWRGLVLWMELTAEWHTGPQAVEVRAEA